jgi:hypothetical protein
MTTTAIVFSMVFGLFCLGCAAYVVVSVVEDGVRSFEQSMRDQAHGSED